MESTTQPADLIIRPPEPAWVERLPNGECAVHWQEPVERIVIHVIDNPDLSAAPIATYEFRVSSAERSVVCDLSSVICESRPYFLIDLDGRRHVIAERELPLAGGVNFRDVGGYRTTDGRAVRWGRVFRAGSLAGLTDEDVACLGRLGLRLSCDLRSAEEVVARPDRLPPGAPARHTGIAAEVGRVRRVVTLFRKRHRIQELLQDAYLIMLDQNGPLFAGIILAAADPANLPLVIHCTAGKDRTGLAVALLLLTLGVPEETVIADYTLSNRAFDLLSGRMRSEMEPLFRLGFDEAQLQPFLLAEARTLIGALAHLRRRYGSVEGYLQRAGLDGAAVEQARETLLADDGRPLTAAE
jgi:protein-tyrosine phosphatase